MMSTFASRLRQAMGQAGLTQKDLAILCGVSRAAISQYLSGRHIPGEDIMARLAEATGTTATYLQREDPAVERDPIAYPMVNISVAEAAECLGKSQQFVRVGLQRGILPFGNAVSTKGRNMTYYINPERFREYVTPGRFDAFFGVKPEHTAKR